MTPAPISGVNQSQAAGRTHLVPYRSLNPDFILKTITRLKARIHERFPDRGLAAVADELSQLAEDETGRARRLSRPNIALRLLVTLIIVAALCALAYGAWSYRLDAIQTETETFHIFQGVEALINIALLTVAGIFFLVTLEARMKRNAVLKRLSQLRSIAHIIDMHQLTKDPTVALHGAAATQSSPVRDLSAFELLRYLDYCAEMLSLTGKLAAVYLEHSDDPVVIGAVGEFENLTTDLTQKVWQKITVLESSARFQAEADVARKTGGGDAGTEAEDTSALPPFLQ
ncbi:MAG: hypothetical protein AAGA24_04775 [Pseudomonadota bacterium]